MIKCIHTSDWHVGKKLHGVSLLAEQADFLKQIVMIAQTEQPDFLFISGDIFDRSVPPVEAIECVNKTLTQLRALGIIIIIISGNHDSPQRLGQFRSLVQASGVYIVTDILDAIKPLKFSHLAEPVSIYAVPYADPLVATRAFDVALKTHDDIFFWLAKQWQLQAEQGHKLILAHGYFGSDRVETDSERPLSIGGTDRVSTRHLAGFDYAALGHLHRAQSSGAHIFYSGSPFAYSFSEAGDNKSVNLYDSSTRPAVKKIVLRPLRQVRKLSGYFEDILTQVPGSDDYLAVDLLDKISVYEPMTRLREKFPNILKLTFNTEQNDVSPIRDQLDQINSPLALFSEFYSHVKGEALSESMRKIVERHLQEQLAEGDK